MALWYVWGTEEAARTQQGLQIEGLDEAGAAKALAADLRIPDEDFGLWVRRVDEPNARPVHVELRGRMVYEARIAPEGVR